MSSERDIINRHTGTRLVVLKSAKETGGAYLQLDGFFPAGAPGPPLHIHWRQVEEGTVMAGRMKARIGSKQYLLEPGDFISFPAGTAHAMWPYGPEMLRFTGIIKPALHFETLLRAFFDSINANPLGTPSLFDTAYLLTRYRDEFATPLIPMFLQKLLFPPLVALGRRLGKYEKYEALS